MTKNRKRDSSELEQPIAVNRNIPEIFQIFHNAQFNTVNHKKYIKELKKVYYKLDDVGFKESFTNALNYTFMFGDANGNVDRVLEFIAKFATSMDENDGFLRFLFNVIFDCVSVSGQGVRSRSCQLLGLLLSALGEEATLDDDICDKILDTQLERLQDLRGVIRCRAVITLQRLQNPADEKDKVTNAYIFHMTSDPSPAVRRAVVLNLAKNSRNLLHVMQRLVDVDESVRKAAFLYISSINVTQLKVRQRIHILKVGLMERSLKVRRVVETALVPNWLGTYNGNILELLEAIRLDNVEGAKDSTLVSENLLQSLFRHRQKPELIEWLPIDLSRKLIPPEKLSKESVKYWRYLVRFLHDDNDADNLDLVLPELVTFTEYVRTILETPCPTLSDIKSYTLRQSILRELMNIFPVYDMADEVGRKSLQSLLYDTLTGNHGNFDEEIIMATVRAVDFILPDPKKRIDFVTGIISEIHEPADELLPTPVSTTPVESNEIKILRAGLRISLNEALEEQEEAVRAQDFTLAAQCKDKVDALNKKLEELSLKASAEIKEVDPPAPEIVREKRNDPETLNKCLSILNFMLDSPQITSLTPVLRSLFQNFESMIYKNTEIQENALKTVALYSMLDIDFAKDHKAFFFTQFLEMENEKMVATALKCVFDIMSVHGLQTFHFDQIEEDKKNVRKSKTSDDGSDDEEMGPLISPSTRDTIIELFLRLMNSDCVEFREIIVGGFCRLLMLGQLSSSSLISHLILLWFNPATEEEDTLRQLLGTFFPLYACHVEDAQERLEDAFLSTLSTLAKAPATSPLSEVEQESVLKFLIGLTMPNVAPGASNVHSNLCVKLIHALEKGAEESESIFCRALALLNVPKSISLCEDLVNSLKKLITSITDKINYRNLSKFEANLCINIEALKVRPSDNLDVDRLSAFTEANVSTSTNIDRNSAPSEPKAIESESNTNNINDEKIIEGELRTPIPSTNNIILQCSDSIAPSPKRRKSTITDFDVAKRAITRSIRTPRTATKSSVSTPLVTPNTRSKRKTTESSSVSKPTPKPKPKTARQLNKVTETPQQKSKPSIKFTGKPSAKKPAPKAKKTNSKFNDRDKDSNSSGNISESIIMDSSSDSSDDETVLRTICHDQETGIAVMSDSSSDEEVKQNTQRKKLPNITIQPSSSSDSEELFSSDEEIVVKKPQNKKR